MESRLWRAVAALSVTQVLAWGAQTYAIAVLAPAIARDEGWSASAIFSAYSAALLVQGLASLPVGALVDRVGGRAVMTAGAALSAAALALVSIAPSPTGFLAAWCLVGVAMAMTQYEPAFATLTAAARTREEARRAITLLTFAGGLASTVAWPVSAAVLPWFGWRGVWRLWAGAMLLLAAPLHRALLPPAKAAVSAGPPKPIRGVLRRASFWAVAVALTTGAVLFSAMAAHAIPMLEAAGLSPEGAVAIAALIGPAQVAGRILEFLGLSRVRPSRLAVAAAPAQPLALLALASAHDRPFLAVVAVVLYGASGGILTIVRGTLPAELFGRERYGAIAGALAAPAIAGRAAGPLVAATLFEHAGGVWAPVQAVLIALGMVAVVAFAAAARAAGSSRHPQDGSV
ncbi:MAG: MFS transporter [Elioraea sp.]|nr:MFS transporter [Elioraea sp.]